MSKTLPHNKMGTRPLFPLLISMALPAILSMTVQSLYNIVDSFFVSQISEEALRAVSIVFPVQQMMIACSVGTAVGVNSYLSRSLGRHDHKTAEEAAAHGFVLNTILWAIFVVLGLVGSTFFLKLFSHDAAVISMGAVYMQIVCIFGFGQFMEITMEKTLQSTGNMVLPMVLQMIGAVGNCILDPLMIFGIGPFPAWGVAGAAIATVVAQTIAFITGLIYIQVKPQLVRISVRGFRFRWAIVRGIYQVGVASMVMMMVGAFLVMALNSILRGFSESAISVVGVYYKLQSFVFMPVFGLTQGMMPLIGYNFGARLIPRVRRVIRYGMVMSVIFMTLCTVVFQIIPGPLLMIFKATPEMLRIGEPALRVLSLCYIPASISIITVTLFQGTGEGRRSLIVSLLRQIVLLLPLAWIGSRVFGITAVWWAFPLAEVGALLTALWYKHGLEPRLKAAEAEGAVPEEVAA